MEFVQACFPYYSYFCAGVPSLIQLFLCKLAISRRRFALPECPAIVYNTGLYGLLR